ncbi:hypothetical protein ACFWNT_45320 [Streptomyces sp. NPDC058409]|uniref:hypothetical protein n=1 Tax=Streptomyces sp. NPDC058409 TaxID=3346484 RepID=UPI00365EC7E0
MTSQLTPRLRRTRGGTPRRAGRWLPRSWNGNPHFLPALTGILLGRRCLAYNIRFDHGVLTSELLRHHRDPSMVRAWLEACRWEDAMRPAAVSKGLWSANRRTCRNQRLGGPYDAEVKCHALLRSLQHLAGHG